MSATIGRRAERDDLRFGDLETTGPPVAILPRLASDQTYTHFLATPGSPA